MCGRYKQNTDGDALAALFGAKRRTPRKDARGTLSPGMDAPAIRENSEGRFMDDLYWGFTPGWSDGGKDSRFINARAESVAEKASFRDAFRLRRCILPADGFFEWDARTSPKTPYDITLPGGAPFAFAGIWDRWTNPASGTSIDGFAILTTAASAQMAPYHPRLPVILTASADIAGWLARTSTAAQLQDILARAGTQVLHIEPAAAAALRPQRRESPAEMRQGSLF